MAKEGREAEQSSPYAPQASSAATGDGQDCLSCRIVGTAACLASSAYIATQTRGTKGMHRGIGVVASGGLVVMAAIRAVM